jgi:hypothetical protein
MNAASTLGSTPCPDPLVFTSPDSSSAHAELLSICERLAKVWDERAERERELCASLRRALAGTSNVEDALRAYSENAAQRMRLALEDAQRIFEEHRTMTERFAQPHG